MSALMARRAMERKPRKDARIKYLKNLIEGIGIRIGHLSEQLTQHNTSIIDERGIMSGDQWIQEQLKLHKEQENELKRLTSTPY